MGWRKIPFPYCKQVVYNEIQKILALAIALLLSMMLAACGEVGDGSTSSNTDSSSDVEVTEKVLAPEEEAKLQEIRNKGEKISEDIGIKSIRFWILTIVY